MEGLDFSDLKEGERYWFRCNMHYIDRTRGVKPNRSVDSLEYCEDVGTLKSKRENGYVNAGKIYYQLNFSIERGTVIIRFELPLYQNAQFPSKLKIRHLA